MLFKLFKSNNSKISHIADEDEVGTLCNHSLQFKNKWRVEDEEYDINDIEEIEICKHCRKQVEMIKRKSEED